MPRFLQVLALVMTFIVMGAPAWVAEILEDDCTEECSDESQCPGEGCGDCSIICSSCPRSHYTTPQTVTLSPSSVEVSAIAHETRERFPLEPPPKGVFHPPRRAG